MVNQKIANFVQCSALIANPSAVVVAVSLVDLGLPETPVILVFSVYQFEIVDQRLLGDALVLRVQRVTHLVPEETLDVFDLGAWLINRFGFLIVLLG